MNRRRVLALLSVTIPISGCTFRGSDTDGTPSDHPPSTTSEPTAETATSTPTSENPSPRAYLPESTDGWELERTGDFEWSVLGGNDGIRGYYTGPDGGSYEVLVMFSEYPVDGSARSWACAGWQIALALDSVAMAASTGTDQRTFTPERPPQMTQTPASEREAEVRELLTLSPKLTAAVIEDNRVECS